MQHNKGNSKDENAINWWKEISDSAEWFHARAWTFSGGLLLLSSVYLYQFIAYEKVPLSITSTSIITSLPIVLALTALSIIVLGGALLSPTSIFFTPIEKEGKTLSQIINKKQSSKIKKHLILRWFAGLFWVGGAWAATLALYTKFNIFTGFPTLIFVWITYALITMYRITPEAIFNKKTIEFWAISFALSFCQIIVITYSLIIAAKAAEAREASLITLAIFSLSTLSALAAIQTIFFLAIPSIKRTEHIIPKAASAGFLTLLILGTSSPFGAKAVGHIYSFSASGGRDCSIITWEKNENPTMELISERANRTSIPLRIIATDGGSYLVRKLEPSFSEVYFISQSSVSKIEKCK